LRRTTSVQAAAPGEIEGPATASVEIGVRELADRLLAGAPAWLLPFAFVVSLGANDGGYWPTSWGWAALVLLTICALALVARMTVRLGALEAAALIALLALTAWGLVSALWNSSATQPLLQSQRTLVYAAGVFAALLLVRSRSYRFLLGGVWLAITLVSGYSLLTRLFPDRLGSVDDLAGYRLDQPLGYWNALGVFAAIGSLLALGFAARGRNPAVRALAAASTLVLVPTLYFTFSRGSWIALGAGLLAAVMLERRRLQLVSALLVAGLWPALAVWHASGSKALTHQRTALAAASHAGHRFALVVLGLAAAAAVATLLLTAGERLVRVPRAVRVAYAGALVLVVAGALAAVTIRFGSPPTIARHVYRGFVGPAEVNTSGNLNRRLFDLSGGQRIPQWKIAWREYRAHPWLGSGLGSYERYWNQLRPGTSKVRNAHCLYLETLAELGPVGLGLLLVALCLPLVAAVRARRRSLASAAAGAYVAFLVHTAVDWDWQMPAVTLAALFCGAALLVGARQPSVAPIHPRLRLLVLAGVLAAAGFAFVGLRGNQAIAAGENAAREGNLSAAVADARRASRWAPWSSRPWQLRGEAELERHRLAAARADLHEAAAKDPADWSIWLDLALASKGRERSHALAQAARLNPLNPVIASFGSR
jgi:O-antigen ligase